MLFLSEDAMKYAISMCSKNSNYRVVVVADDAARAWVANNITLATVEYPDRVHINQDNQLHIEWRNRSSLDVVRAADETVRGRRANLLIVDGALSDDQINEYRHIEILDMVRRRLRPDWRRDNWVVNEQREVLWTITVPDNEENAISEDEEKDSPETDIAISEDDLLKVLGLT